ncbi:dynamin family protein [Helicobacter sp.]|uniref:dynamin family protein n=1 Tax=Helicobacter sp. TaxID=218 RepID=UPI0025C2EDCE|nr:dynamin family protein [Helicobacter sp.]MCI5969415.1 dynamin family protein [Helicobacter sp.]MDY2585670.1 dynamin family protein [Helicobacter sp.]
MLKSYIQDCKILQEKFRQKTPTQKLIANCQNTLNPNDCTLSFFENLAQQSTEPMQIAIIGQFSSGKSTFLNALLGQDILPTGITPITSKICKICYGEDYILEILYKDGKKVLQNVEFLHKLSRENSKTIDHFCLYAPILFLKDINFLDTPGFNSQNSEDTNATLKILEQVDGIIWLTLIDNAGKNSEKELLKGFSTHFAQKSLCVLNQKDRLKNEREIQTSVEYAKKAFEGIFAEVIPISAKLALKARLNTTEKFLETTLLDLAHSIQNIALRRTDSTLSLKESSQKLQALYTSTQEKINSQSLDKNDFEALMQNSNMPLVFAFLNQTIKPKAKFAKSHSALKRLKERLIRLHLQYHKINQSYKNLQKILLQSIPEFTQNCATSKAKEQKIFNALYWDLDVLLDNLAQKIFNALQNQSIAFHKNTKTLLGTKLKIHEKEVTILPLEKIKIALQNQDTQLVKDYKAISMKIKNFLDLFMDSIHKNINALSEKILHWQDITPKSLELYLIAPQSQALQDLHHFTQHCYANILTDYNKNALVATSFLRSELSVLSNFLSLNYNNAIDLTLTKLDLKIKNAIAKHQENQEEFALFHPTLENVREILNEAFCFEQFQAHLFGPMNSLNKAYAQFLEQNEQTTESKTKLIAQISFALKKEMDKIQQNLKAIRTQILTL